jgi:hypothetical protein
VGLGALVVVEHMVAHLVLGDVVALEEFEEGA